MASLMHVGVLTTALSVQPNLYISITPGPGPTMLLEKLWICRGFVCYISHSAIPWIGGLFNDDC